MLKTLKIQYHYITFILITVFYTLHFNHAVSAELKVKKLLPAQQAILDSFIHLESDTAKKSDYLNLKKLSKSKKYLFLALPLLAQYEREINNKSLKSLKTVAPYLFVEKSDCDKLIKNIKSFILKSKEHKKNPDSEVPVLLIPENAEINFNSVWHCIEAGRAFFAFGYYDKALEIFDNIGRNSKDFSRVMAAEAAGDVFAMQRQWEKAEEWYRSANVFYKAWLKSPSVDIDDNHIDLISQAGPSVEAMIEESIVSWSTTIMLPY